MRFYCGEEDMFVFMVDPLYNSFTDKELRASAIYRSCR